MEAMLIRTSIQESTVAPRPMKAPDWTQPRPNFVEKVHPEGNIDWPAHFRAFIIAIDVVST